MKFGATAAALGLGLALLSVAASAAATEGFDPRVRDMLQRARAGEKPTPQDQRIAARALRDWDLSERTAPSGDRRMRRFLETIVRGEHDPQFSSLAWELRRKYLTREGLRRRMREGPIGRDGRPVGPGSPATTADSPEPPDPLQYWLLFVACVVILLGGVVIWALGRRRKRPDYRVYYS